MHRENLNVNDMRTKTSAMVNKFRVGQNVLLFCLLFLRYIGDVMASMLTSSVVVRGVKPLSGQTKDYKISAAFPLSVQE
jgi:hypothetical protein